MAATQTSPSPLKPLSKAPTAKEKRYDRQLRLWAASGQAALEDAKILLLNSGPGVVGVETLKNLILPGVGSFTIVDDAVVEDKDLGVNFFLEADSLGKSRAEECTRLLKELNSEVEGKGIKSSISSFVSGSQFKVFTLVILNGPSPDLHSIATLCWESSRPLFYIHSVGFHSHFSIQLPSLFPVVDTHPDPASTQDLRLLDPWPELVEHTKKKTSALEKLPDHDHGHIPWLLLLLHYLDKWEESHDGKPPQNYGEKKEFKSLVENGARRNNPEGGEENFEEGAAAVLKSLNPPSMPSGLREVFETEECKSLSATSANFWVIAQAIHSFHTQHGLLPLPGALPDMKAQSAEYIILQSIYKGKARSDLAEVTTTVRSLEKSLNRTQPIDETEIEAFCKGAAFVKLLRGKPIRFAHLSSPSKPKTLKDVDWTDVASGLSLELQMQEESLLPIYLSFLAYDQYQLQKQLSTEMKSQEQPDFLTTASASANGATNALAAAAGLSDLEVLTLERRTKDVLLEFERAADGELHNIGALTGGMVAQEVIKVITKQYVPVDNACVFDGIVSKAAVFMM